MAKSSESKINKSREIREYLALHPSARPQAVAKALEANGVEVTPGFVSSIKFSDKRKGKMKKNRRVLAPRSSAEPAPTTVGGVDVNTLSQVNKLVDQMGGIAEARKALEVLAKILNKK